MDYRKFGETYYIRMDKGDEIVSGLLKVCEKEQISSAVFSGIGGLSEACVQIFIPEEGAFEDENIRGTLELVSLNGNIVSDREGALYHHTHALISYRGTPSAAAEPSLQLEAAGQPTEKELPNAAVGQPIEKELPNTAAQPAVQQETGVHALAAGHIKSLTVLYTAEIELRPVIGGTIHRKYDPETGTGFWDFED